MKNHFFLLTTLFAVLFVFNSCSDDDDNSGISNLTGYWQCKGVGANAFGLVNTGSQGGDYLKYFSLSFVGTKTKGVYARLGSDDLTDIASAVAGMSVESLGSMLSAGSYTMNGTQLTLTPKGDGEAVVYNYTLTDNTLVLSEYSESSNETVDNVLSVISGLFGVNTSKVNTNVGIEYTYEKLSGLDAFNKLRNKE